MKTLTTMFFVALLSLSFTKSQGQFGRGRFPTNLPKNKAQGSSLSNPFKNSTVEETNIAFQRHVESGKLKVKSDVPATGAKSYQNTKSRFSYNVDPGRNKSGVIVEEPHVDVNYPNPKPKNVEKKKLPLKGENQ